MFIVTKEELENLRSQFGTTDLVKTGALPFAFIEQGVYQTRQYREREDERGIVGVL
jgi:hypothetical protein